MSFGQPPQMIGQRFFVARNFFADQHQIDFQSAQMPEGVRGKNFAHHFHIPQMSDRHDDDRHVARDTLRPERALAGARASETGWGRAQLRLREEDVPGELLEELDIVRPDMETAQLELRTGPRGFKSAGRNAELRVALGQSNDRLPRVRHHRHDGKLEASIGSDRDPPAQAENRIKHSAGALR